MVQNFAVFADRLPSAKMKTAKIAASAISIAPCLPVCAGTAKIKTAKFSLGALKGDSAKFCIRKNFLLYGIRKVLSVRADSYFNSMHTDFVSSADW